MRARLQLAVERRELPNRRNAYPPEIQMAPPKGRELLFLGLIAEF